MKSGPTAAALAEVFAHHKKHCTRCSSVNLERPATLADACLEGARMFKDAASAAHGEIIAARARGARRVPYPQDELRGELSSAEEHLAARVARHCGKP